MNNIVEKMWISLGESLWEKCGKVFRKLWISELYTYLGRFLHVLNVLSGKFYKWFCTQFFLCKIVGFPHFPHSLLLQLLN